MEGVFKNIGNKDMTNREMNGTESLVEAALRVLNTADPFEKARLGEDIATKWLEGLIVQPYNPNNSQDYSVPDRPARLINVNDLILIVFQYLHSTCSTKCLTELFFFSNTRFCFCR